MLDRTVIQLMVCEQLMYLDTQELARLLNQLTGCEMEIYEEEEEILIGRVESMKIDDPDGLNTWLEFMHNALTEKQQSSTD